MKMMYLLLGVVLCLVGLQSEAMPYVSFMGRTLANNSYVDMNFVGNDSDQYNNLLCHTDLSSCCSNPQGPHRGDWYFPNGSRFQFSHVGFYESRGEQVVILQKELGTDMPSGIYRCGIPTVAVHDDTNIFVRQSVYVGIYAHGGELGIEGDVDYSYTEGPFQVNLTTTTIGGPPTIVTWTKNCATAVGNITTFVNDTITSKYVNKLTIIPYEVKGAFFIFTASNDKPSKQSVIYPPEARNVSVSSVSVHLVNASAVRVQWTGKRYLYTSVHYTSYFSETGSAMSHYETVLRPYEDFTDVAVNDDSPGYEHRFTLHYIFCNVVPADPEATVTFAFDKKYFQVQFGPVEYCLNWGVEKKAFIENELQTELVRIIRQNCTDCYKFSTAFLRKGLFLCHKHPIHVTYRSTLVNPFPSFNSSELVGIIQSWVSSNPHLVLDGLLVRVNPHCPTCLDSLGDGECKSGAMSDPDRVEWMTQVLSVCAVREIGDQICVR